MQEARLRRKKKMLEPRRKHKIHTREWSELIQKKHDELIFIGKTGCGSSRLQQQRANDG